MIFTSRPNQSRNNLKKAIEFIVAKKPYVEINTIKDILNDEGFKYQERTVKEYLYRLVKNGKLYSAGRGWYSSLPDSFPLDTRPLQPFITLMQKQFPLLSFSCWSGIQLQSWFHHLPVKLPLFVYVERDAFDSVFDYLREHYRNCYLNPQKRDVQRNVRLSEDSVIIRPVVSEAPGNEHEAPIEKILVDLYIERERLYLFDLWEYERLFKAIIHQFRINMAGLLRYAGRREIAKKIRLLID